MGTIKPKGRRLRLSQRPGPALRCKDAVSRAEVDLETMKAGRLLLREVSERHCQELEPDLSRLLRKITGRRLLDKCVASFFSRREKIYLFTMSGRVKQ